MRTVDKVRLVIGIWVPVYLFVMGFNLGLRALGIDWPTWLEILISTGLSVPFISLVLIPYIEGWVAAGREQSRAELKLDEAREAEGPDPDEAGR